MGEERAVELVTADAILNLDDVKVERLEVPEWGKDGVPAVVYIRTFEGSKRDYLERMVSDNDKRQMCNFRAEFAVRVICTEGGGPVFTDLQATLLGKKSAAALDRILDAGLTLNGMDKDAVESAEKNSATTPTGDSGTD